MKTNLERFFSSFVTTIVLLLIYAFGLAVATFIEKYHGTATAKAMVYYSPLFFLLQFLLVVNFIAATIKHQYLKRGKWGLMLTHFAFIIILLGALTSFLFGEEGILHLREGETSNQIAVRTSDNTTFHTLPFSVELKKFTLTVSSRPPMTRTNTGPSFPSTATWRGGTSPTPDICCWSSA